MPCALDRAGNLWVGFSASVDFGETSGPPAEIRVYSASGRVLRRFGSFGDGPGQLKGPTGLAIHTGQLYVAGKLPCLGMLGGRLGCPPAAALCRQAAAGWAAIARACPHSVPAMPLPCRLHGRACVGEEPGPSCLACRC